MTRFQRAVQQVPTIANSYRPGLQALGRDSRMITCGRNRCLTGSINLEESLSSVYPNEPRWDYGIGVSRNPSAEEAIWIEIHPASSTHVEDVLRKLHWLKEWLAHEAVPLNRLTRGEFYWVATGAAIHITPHSRQARQLAAAGLRGPKKPPLNLDRELASHSRRP